MVPLTGMTRSLKLAGIPGYTVSWPTLLLLLKHQVIVSPLSVRNVAS